MIPIHQLPEAPPPPNEPPPLENDELDEERLDEKLLRDDDEELEYVRDELDIREASFVSGPPPWRCSLEIWRMMAYTTRPTRISGASTIKQVNPRNAIATSGCSRGSAGRLVSRRGASAPPSIRLASASTPASMPSAYLPSRNRGTISSRITRLEMASVIVPSRRYPTSTRTLRSSRKTKSTSPLSSFL